MEELEFEFEKYIIFHRGIKEVDVKSDNHLHVIYQDDYDQDLGDPFGDDARAIYTQCIAMLNTIDTRETTLMRTYANVQAAAQDASEAFSDAQAQSEDATAAYNRCVVIKQQVQAIADSIDVDGIPVISNSEIDAMF